MHHTDVILRDAQARDLDAMVGLLRQLFTIEDGFKIDERKQRHGLAALMADHGRSIVRVAEVRSCVVGMCTAQINISTAEGGMSALVEDMIVDEPYRRRGIGSLLLENISQWATEHQCVRLQLLTDIRNDAALQFYANARWHKTTMICMNKKIYAEPDAAVCPPRYVSVTARR
jgi:GNAT superfamily N-acetyltransferase